VGAGRRATVAPESDLELGTDTHMAKIDNLARAVSSAAAKYATAWTDLRRDHPPAKRAAIEGRLERTKNDLRAAVEKLLEV
jgi:hypothetical protein